MIDTVAGTESFDHEGQAYAIHRHAPFEDLIRQLRRTSPSSGEADFARILAHARQVLGRSDLQMARLFKVSPFTIDRWIRGASAPHPSLRKSIVDALLIEVHLGLEGLRMC